jgi:hypothetical protein
MRIANFVLPLLCILLLFPSSNEVGATENVKGHDSDGLDSDLDALFVSTPRPATTTTGQALELASKESPEKSSTFVEEKSAAEPALIETAKDVAKIIFASNSAIEEDDDKCHHPSPVTAKGKENLAAILQGTERWTALTVFGIVYFVLFFITIPLFLHRRHNPVIAHRSPMFAVAGNVAGMTVVGIMMMSRNLFSYTSYAEVMHLYEWAQNCFLPMVFVCLYARFLRLHKMSVLEDEKIRFATFGEAPSDAAHGKQRGGRGEHQLEVHLLEKRAALMEENQLWYLVPACFSLAGLALVWEFFITNCHIQREQDALMALGTTCTLAAILVPLASLVKGARVGFGVRRELWAAALVSALCSVALVILFVLMKGWQHRFDHAPTMMSAYHIFVVTWMTGLLLITAVWPLLLSRERAVPQQFSPASASPLRDFGEVFEMAQGRAYLFAHLASEFASELMLFHAAVEDFRLKHASEGEDTFEKAQNDSKAAAAMKEDAKRLYNSYVREGGPLAVPLTYDTVLECGYRLHGQTGADMFDACQDAVYVKMMRSYHRFLHTPFAAECNAAIGRKSRPSLIGSDDDVEDMQASAPPAAADVVA